MMNGLLLFVAMVTITFNIKYSYAGGKMKIVILRYENPSGTEHDGTCCDRCREACKNQFKFCFSDANKPSVCLNSKTLSEPVLNDKFDVRLVNMFGSTRGANFDLSFPYKIPETLRFKVMVRNIISGKDALVADFTKDYDMTVDKPSMNEHTLIYKSKSGDKTLKFSISVKCDTDYIGKVCEIVRCKPRNDVTGHYNCTHDNKKKCLPGWKDETTNCTVAIKPPIISSSFKIVRSTKLKLSSQKYIVSPVTSTSIKSVKPTSKMKTSQLASILNKLCTSELISTSSQKQIFTSTNLATSKTSTDIITTNIYLSSSSSPCVRKKTRNAIFSTIDRTETRLQTSKPQNSCSILFMTSKLFSSSVTVTPTLSVMSTPTKPDKKAKKGSNVIVTRATLGAGAVVLVSLFAVIFVYIKKRWKSRRKISSYDQAFEMPSTENKSEKSAEMFQRYSSSSTSKLIPTDFVQSDGCHDDKT